MTTTAVLPLTTTFSPPADCTTDSYHVLWSTSSEYSWWWLSLGVSEWSTCFPSGYQPTSYFSPGVCPDGYTAAGQSYISSNSETQATCCPSFYNAQTGDDWPWYTSNPCTSSAIDNSNVHSFTWDNTVYTETGTYGINAKGISIRWKSDDFASQTATATATATTTTAESESLKPSSTTIATPTASLGGAVESHTPSSGLSTGAKAGIGIGVSVGVIALLVIAFFIYRRRRKTNPDMIIRSDQPREADSRPIYEANPGPVYEIDSNVRTFGDFSETQPDKPDPPKPMEMAIYK